MADTNVEAGADPRQLLAPNLPPPKHNWLLIVDILVAIVLVGGVWFAGPAFAAVRGWYLFGALLFPRHWAMGSSRDA